MPLYMLAPSYFTPSASGNSFFLIDFKPATTDMIPISFLLNIIFPVKIWHECSMLKAWISRGEMYDHQKI